MRVTYRSQLVDLIGTYNDTSSGNISSIDDRDIVPQLSSRASGLTAGLQGSVNVHRGALLLVPQ